MSLTLRPGAASAETGSHESFQYEIYDPSTTTSVVRIHVPAGGAVKAVPGCMVATSGNIEIKGKLKKKMRALLGPDEARHQTLSAADGAGWVVLAPGFYGSVRAVHLEAGRELCVGDDAFLASVGDVESTSVRQSAKKALFSGHGLFVKKVKGSGVVFVAAVGSMMEMQVPGGEGVIVDSGHLVTWPADVQYDMQRASKGLLGTGLSGEGMVCKITGPGTLNVQTRNPEEIAGWVYDTKTPPSGA